MSSRIKKTYPDSTLADACRARGANVALMWEMKGPETTGVAWLSCYVIDAGVCIVQSYKGGGWDAYTPCGSPLASDAITDVLERCAYKRFA
jgi:hypothetical protein